MSEEYYLARNKDGYYEIRWSERDEAAGRTRTRSYSCRTKIKREAEAVKTQWVEARGLILATQTGNTVGNIIDLYIERHVERENASETQKWSLRPVKKWFEYHDVGEVTEDELQAYQDSRFADVKTGTVRKELSAFKAALNWAASPKRKPRIITADDVPHIDLPPDGPPRTYFLQAEDADKLFDLAQDRVVNGVKFSMYVNNSKSFHYARIGLFICLAMETAAREGAIRGLTWDRVHLDRRQIDFRDPDKAVTKKRRVPVPISAKLYPVLKEAYDRRDESNPFVLEHDGSIQKQFRDFADNAGFKELHVHDMRRTWATLRVMWGASIDKVAAILGDTVEVTQKHYAHFQPGYGSDVMDMRPMAAE